MNTVSDDYVLVIGSKPFSKLPNILVKKIYCANGAAERAYEYKKKFKNIQVTSVVGASEFNKKIEVRDRVLKLKPDNIFCRSGKIYEEYCNNELLNTTNILNLSKFKQFFWQAKFYKFGILTLFFSELVYENILLKKFQHLYDCIKWRGFLCSSTGLFAILLAYLENPNATIVVSGIGIKSGGETFYGSNTNKTSRSNVDQKLFLNLKKDIKKKLITTDKEMSDFCKIELWKKELM